jgi:hypothetical protein
MNNTTLANITLVADSTEAIAIGTTYIVGRCNTGNVSFVAGAGATIYSSGQADISVQWGKVVVFKTATNTWEIDGAVNP